MKHWFKKISAVLMTIMTLGMYIPPTYMDASAEEDKDNLFPANENMQKDVAFSDVDDLESMFDSDQDFSSIDSSEDYIQLFTEQAREQTFSKLGPRIANKVEDDFMTEVFPGMEEVITNILDEIDEEEFPFIEINEQQSSVYGEKIFNIYDNQSKEDVARFHVRRDLRPKEGYWFNFHYHLRDDNYEEHHAIGEIYWDKNTPPKWMS
ncbi:YpjP family protein [Salipaludibacillus daqingensis]|uniref:YpjP family protein n=1 Tax=Salipaludibacillus daqingensis TaxID=3041001 RepID=UPI0024765034|nr:YpjP family protein [Salipaludibacillus daqingensis]